MLHRPRAVEAVAFVLGTLLAACDGPGNTGRPVPVANLVEAVPWQNGVLPHLDATGMAIVADLPQYPPIQLGLPDLPAPWPTDCRGVDAFEFSRVPGGDPRTQGWFDDFEPLEPTDPNATGIANGWASYDDLTKFSWHTPGDATWYPGLKGTIHTVWGLPAEQTPGPSCDGVTRNDWVLHFKGGLFRKWGAGVSHAFTDPDGRYRTNDRVDACAPENDFCSPPVADGATVDSAGIPTHAANGDAYLQSHDFFDVSKYDGLAFWARRGPEGSASALVILTDKFTSSRLAFENQKYCRRILECHTRCLSGTPCSPDDPSSANPIYRCWDPKQGKLPEITAQIEIESQLELMYPRCGPSACTSPSSYPDRDFDGKQCTPYTFPAADESGEYCWNPGQDKPPPSRDERCQDGWQTVVELTPEWKLYTLPWSQFGQVGFGKKAPYMDLKSLDTMAFGTPMGYADVYFDNVTLYRRKK